ncbi:hypothetical protein ACOMHN_064757 [Nucella lapillus]
MFGVAKIKPTIAAFSLLILLLSILRIAYEFHSAQQSIDHLADNTDSRAPSLPHTSDHPSPHPASLPVDPRTTLPPPPSLLRTVSVKRKGDDVGNADMKIDNDNTGHGRHAQHGHAPTSVVAGRAVSVSPAATSASEGTGRGGTSHAFVIVVCSKPENTELRLAIRRSWGIEVNASKVMLRFFVGQNDDWDKIITREQDIHGDVIRTEYMDTYENLSYKVLAAMSWALRNVGSVQHVMKIDDDTYVNLPFLLSELRDISVIKDATQLYVIGAVCVNSSVVRDEGNKWFVSHLDYPSDVYPTYVFGGGYVMTKSAAAGILAASAQADYLHLEDVFVTGILARAAGVRHLSHPAFAFWTSPTPSPCDLVTGRRLTAVTMTPKQFYAMYSGIHAILRTGNWTAC